MSILEKFKPITTFVFDIDGVLTDGSIAVYDNGDQVRRMSIKDGYSLQLAIKKGYRVVVISGGASEGVKKRLLQLGVIEKVLKLNGRWELDVSVASK